MAMETKNKTLERLEQLKELLPEVITETKDANGDIVSAIDAKKLEQLLSTKVIEGDESYDFTWVGKKQAMVEASRPIRKTLRPCKEESVDWENTENLYIEGDNLDVLKLLQESYLNKIKMIHIDPPYNTGNDFVYKDNYKTEKERYDLEANLKDDDYNITINQHNEFFKNTEANGKFHSNWCSMMYPRLKLARNLLSDDGVIFISIDENEFDNLKKLCDEVFGKQNFIENFIWIKNSTKNLSKTTSTNHEYVMCYAKNRIIIEDKSIFRIEKPGLQEVKELLKDAQDKHFTPEETEIKLKTFYKSRPDLKGISMYDRVDIRQDKISGQKCLKSYRLDNISAPKSSGRAATYDVVHPRTGLPCKSPTRGWAFTRETMDEHIKNNLIHFYEDETKVPQFKRYLDTVETEVIKSTFEDFTDGKKEFMRLFEGEAYFDNPKPTTLLHKFLLLPSKDSIILDFFSGSATTAHAVMQLNAEDGGNRKFIMVQLPEVCDEKSEAYKAGYQNICEIGKERIRRAGKKIVEETGKQDLDIGFRVFKVDDTNMKDVYYAPADYNQSMLDKMTSNIKEDRTPEDLLYACMLEWGLELSLPHETKAINGYNIHIVNEGDLIACFDDKVSEDVIKQIADMEPLRVVFRDSSFATDSARINVDEIFKLKSPNTKIKVL